MRRTATTIGFFVGVLTLLVSGCATVQDPPTIPRTATPRVSVAARQAGSINPLFVQTDDPDFLWESIVDVIDNYFPTPREYPIQTYSYDEDGVPKKVETEGRIDTDPVIAAGLLEPWKKNSVSCQQRFDATLQTIRRSAVVRVVPEDGGYSIHLSIYDEIEDLAQPMNASTNGSNLLFSDDFSQLQYPSGEVPYHKGWVPMGRNREMEDYLLQEIAWRFQNVPAVVNPENAAAQPASTNNAANTVPIIP